MPLTQEEIKRAFKKFIDDKNPKHRYASYDYCYNYFHSFADKKDLIIGENLEKSCLVLGFYLASWGMLRASSFLLQKSITFYKPIITWISNDCPSSEWEIDVNTYNDDNIESLIDIFTSLSTFIPKNNRKEVLVTKMMLGVFGNTPAFDEYFTKTFRQHYNRKPAFSRFNKKSLQAIKLFYDDNATIIDSYHNTTKTHNFLSEEETDKLYTRAKIIDMIGFGHSYKPKKGKKQHLHNR
jgi:hypothetical protein